jgi:hypothetical protein
MRISEVNEMTTKKELIENWTQELRQVEAQIVTTEQEHKQFKAEGDEYEELGVQRDKIDVKLNRLLQGQYEGNWGDHDEWYHSRIPTKFSGLLRKFGHRVVSEALNELRDEKMRAIETSEEYKALKAVSEGLWKAQCKVISEPHQSIHHKLYEGFEGLYDSRKRLESLIRNVEGKGWFIQYCKRQAEHDRNVVEHTKLKKDIKDCRKAIDNTEITLMPMTNIGGQR